MILSLKVSFSSNKPLYEILYVCFIFFAISFYELYVFFTKTFIRGGIYTHRRSLLVQFSVSNFCIFYGKRANFHVFWQMQC